MVAHVAQPVEHIHGKDGVAGSIPAVGSIKIKVPRNRGRKHRVVIIFFNPIPLRRVKWPRQNLNEQNRI